MWECDFCERETNEIWHYSLPIMYRQASESFIQAEPKIKIKDKPVGICKDCREKLAYEVSRLHTVQGRKLIFLPFYAIIKENERRKKDGI